MIWPLVTTTDSFPAHPPLCSLWSILALLLHIPSSGSVHLLFLLLSPIRHSYGTFIHFITKCHILRAFLTSLFKCYLHHVTISKLVLFFFRSFTTSYDSTILVSSVFPPPECKAHERINFFCLISIFLEQSLAQNECSKIFVDLKNNL